MWEAAPLCPVTACAHDPYPIYLNCSTLGEDVCQEEDVVFSPQVGAQALDMLQELALDEILWDLNPIGFTSR